MAACSGQPAGSRRAVRGARISETRLLRSHLHGKPASVRGPARWPGHCWFQIGKGRGQIYINYVDFLYHEQRIMLSNLIIAVVKDVVKVLLLLMMMMMMMMRRRRRRRIMIMSRGKLIKFQTSQVYCFRQWQFGVFVIHSRIIMCITPNGWSVRTTAVGDLFQITH